MVDRVVVIHRGSCVAEGSPAEIKDHVAVLAGFAAVSVAFAVVAFRRDEGRTYG
jgi:ABC-type Na+ transport system ATPase subunit NatA